MLNEKETELIMGVFFQECLAFWNRTVTDTREAFKKAIRDILGVHRSDDQLYLSQQLANR